MRPIHPISPIPSTFVAPANETLKPDPALNPLKQSLVVISPLTPSLESNPNLHKEPKLKLSAIEDKTQATNPSKIPEWPQLILDLSAYKDPTKLLSALDRLKREELSYLKLSLDHLPYLNIGFIQNCQALGFKFFLDAAFTPLKTQTLAALSYISPSFVSYNLEGCFGTLAERLFQAHAEYLPNAQVVLSSIVASTSLAESMQSLAQSYQKVMLAVDAQATTDPLHPLRSAQLPKGKRVSPYIHCTAPVLAELSQSLGTHFPFILQAEDPLDPLPFQIAQTPGLKLAAFIVLGRSILDAEDPSFELDKALGYLKA